MGAYLSHPKTEKSSTDELNDLLVVGASSMQGWRNSQEDAHNSILNFDINTSLFAVYDGHGGAEVAQYCADKLPEFLKNLDAYKKGQFGQALKDAFLGFDKTLLDPPVVTILKILAGEHNFVDGEDAEVYEEDEDEDLAELHEESNLPLNEVLEKYKGLPQTHELVRLKTEAEGNFKLQAPCLRGRRAAAVAAEAANKAVMDPTAKPEGSSTSAAAAAAAFSEVSGPSPSHSKAAKLEDESAVTSSSSSSANKSIKDLINSETVADKTDKTNGSSSSLKLPTDQNGSVTSSEVIEAVDTVSEESVVSRSTDIDDAKENGSLVSSTGTKPEVSVISSTSKESEKNTKKLNTAQDDESTDDDADYDENAIIEEPEVATADSSDEDMDDGAENDDDDDEDDDDDMSDEEEADEDQLANDQFCANMIEEPGKDSGCTAVVCLLHGRDLYVANAGDSRCVISRNGKTIEMSLDHKPEDDEEATRIVKAGGRVTLDGRVNGGLNLSRALGDHAYKTNLELPAEAQMISALPDVKKLIITPSDEFMVLACDGIWNYMSSEEVVDFVRLRLNDENKKLSNICEELFDNCLAPNTMGDGTGCDNMTAVIVKFQPKLQQLLTSINPSETEDVSFNTGQENEQSAVLKNDDNVFKRSASPDNAPEADLDETANKSKRLKTESELESMDSPADEISGTPSIVEQKECVSIKADSESTVVSSS
ncbi:probable protein phosphatase CG10417 [Drosophila obscura]|uniref:probable protein phosphatase CG10417 n=1 Tax=Drosophila obscura TaxID=7282 RepID=UPI001BB1D554|nr:probable protein phosphatase CG10417 [Drosophila obscura]XP_041450228.1 probable protein phosphatase CG10417 [Drosophila obscura]XP_041450229.1 probable protein phosphatase CG10417 [Drosophila obscura]